jgi:hypothetical protein
MRTRFEKHAVFSDFLHQVAVVFEKINKPVKYSDIYDIAKMGYKPVKKLDDMSDHILRRGSFSRWVRFLIMNNLLEELYEENNKKSKQLSITKDGIFAVRFFFKQVTTEQK